MRKIFWSITGLTVGVYAVNVLIQYGFNSYFGIPGEFSTASIATNIVNFFELFKFTRNVFNTLPWWMWSSALLVILFISFWCYCNPRHKKFFSTIGMLLVLWMIYLCFSFGTFVAKTQNTFLVPTPGCISVGTATGYIVPSFYNDQAIFIPVNPNTKKMAGGFFMRNLSELPCVLKHEKVGPILK